MDAASGMTVTPTQAVRTWNGGKLALFMGMLLTVVAFDLGTKLLIQNTFHLYESVDVIGDYVRLTYIHNPGAAFGITLGPPAYSRFIFLGLSLVALVAL